MIEKYDFGVITINGRKYTSDVIVTPEEVEDDWWREEGHSVAILDIEDIINRLPQVIVFGTGYSGEMKILKETKEFIKSKGIKLIVKKTQEAVREYNDLEKNKVDVVGCFHLTC